MFIEDKHIRVNLSRELADSWLAKGLQRKWCMLFLDMGNVSNLNVAKLILACYYDRSKSYLRLYKA